MRLACKLPCKTWDKLLSQAVFLMLKNMLKNVQRFRLTDATIYLKKKEINKKMES